MKRRARRRLSLPSISGIRSVDIGLILAIALLTFVILLGGATRQRYIDDAILQLISLPVLGVGLFRLANHPFASRLALEQVLLAMFVALPLLYLVPLPPELWQSIPGREFVASADRIAGLGDPWRPLSLDTEATLRSWLSILPAVSLFLITACLAETARVTLVKVLIVLTLISTFVGLDQVIGLFSQRGGFALGSFANRNHFAVLLAASIPLAGGLVLRKSARDFNELLVRSGALVILFVVLLIGIGASQSRAGLALGILAILGVTAMVSRSRFEQSHRGAAKPLNNMRRVAVIAGVIAVLAMAEFAAGGLARLLTTDLDSGYRAVSRTIVLETAISALPLGSGFGTFVPLYAMQETPEAVQIVFLNRAHNDWIELVIEGGVPAAILAGMFVSWWAYTSLRAWRGARPYATRTSLNLARAASLVIALLLLHSFVDYPLRTTIMMSVLAIMAGLLVPAIPDASGREAERGRRRPRTGHEQRGSGGSGRRRSSTAVPDLDRDHAADVGTSVHHAPSFSRDAGAG